MKKMIFLLAAGWCGVLAAQTNAPAPGAKAHPPTEIDSDAADFDLNAHQAVYRGHVKVVDPQVKLTCGWMIVDLPSAGGHLNHVVAETNVVVDFKSEKGEKYHVTSAKAVYDYNVVDSVTNETVTFTGDPIAETPDYRIFSEPLVWDRVLNKFHLYHEKIISLHPVNAGSGTNAPLPNLLK
jgi:lipopolysaccharide export system protein LptA